MSFVRNYALSKFFGKGAGGSGGGFTIDDIVNPIANVKGDIVITTTSCRGLSETKVTSVIGENVTNLAAYAFRNCKELVSASFPNVVNTYGSNQIFQGCAALKNVNMERCHTFGTGVFDGTDLEQLVLPNFETAYDILAQNCKSLKVVDLGNPTKTTGSGFIRQHAFSGCNSLEALILRHNKVVWIGNVNNLGNTPLTGYGGTYSGHVYIPSALLESYKTDTNWAALYANYPEIFQPIEGSEYE